VSSSGRFWTSAAREFAARSGYARLMARRDGGIGVILGFERVRPPRRAAFQPLKPREITPAFLDRAISALKRWKYDFISIDDVCAQLARQTPDRRFVCLTFDGTTRDLMTSAYPVLSRHEVPFAVYVPTAFPDGLGEAWWLALERVIAAHDRVSLVMDRRERHFNVAGAIEKQELFDYLSGWLRKLPPADLSAAINDLCSRYGTDFVALSRDAALGWGDLATLAADPRVTIGSATVNSSGLASLKDASALREMTMGRAVLQAALGRDVRHFAYPFGDRASFGRKHMLMAEEAGFASAVSSLPGVILPEGRSNPFALARLKWDGPQSLRALRTMTSGLLLDDG
jgi:peptidoglycan/xylan/chitin deacetylase (PgdA/CDA1 family)